MANQLDYTRFDDDCAKEGKSCPECGEWMDEKVNSWDGSIMYSCSCEDGEEDELD